MSTHSWLKSSATVRPGGGEIIGYRLDELLPISIETWAAHVHPDDWSKSGELLQRHFAGTEAHCSIEVRMRHRDGHWVWLCHVGS